jgi:putative addiction module antidote
MLTTIAIELTPNQAAQLQREASRLGVPVEELARAAVADLLAAPDASFQAAVQRVLKTNSEPYRRLTLRRSGGSVSATLPKDMADRLRLGPGDRVLAVETDRGILLTPCDRAAEHALDVGAKVAKSYRSALRQLAK